MTTYVCIPQSKNDDANYRYKMPQMKLSQESRLNGVKTNIKNLSDVARALRVPESAILKYFVVEMGANSEGTTIIKGQHSLEDLSQKLDKFIHRYVLCSKCKLPEITHTAVKKNLVGVCRSCGSSNNSMDTIHKAGKQLHKDIASYYQNNPEFGKKPGAAAQDMVNEAAAAKPKPGSKKVNKIAKQAAAEEAKQKESAQQQEQAKEDRIKKMQETGAEVNRLDAENLLLTDQKIVNAIEELKTFVAEKIADVGTAKPEEILREVRQMQLQLNITAEYKFYICLCGLFGPDRNIVKHWDEFEGVFTTLAGQDEQNGYPHLFQAVIQFFINRHPELKKFAASLCKKLYDNSLLEDEFFVNWHAKTLRLDRHCSLHDKAAESAMRPLLADFVTWLTSADYDEEEAYGEEEPAAKEEVKEEEPVETEAQKNQRLLIEAQKKAMTEQLATAKVEGAERKEAAATEAAAAHELEAIKTTDVAKIEVEDDFDINDI